MRKHRILFANFVVEKHDDYFETYGLLINGISSIYAILNADYFFVKVLYVTVMDIIEVVFVKNCNLQFNCQYILELFNLNLFDLYFLH